jgi:hypothetical protein
MKRKKIEHNLKEDLTVRVTVLNGGTATVAHAQLVRWNDEDDGVDIVEAAGSTKREPGDPRDDSIAAYLAAGRALILLGHQMEDHGRIQVEAATAEQQLAAEMRVARRLLAGMPQSRPLLTLKEIAEEWGVAAAERAARRRGVELPENLRKQAAGRHEKTAKKSKKKG